MISHFQPVSSGLCICVYIYIYICTHICVPVPRPPTPPPARVGSPAWNRKSSPPPVAPAQLAQLAPLWAPRRPGGQRHLRRRRGGGHDGGDGHAARGALGHLGLEARAPVGFGPTYETGNEEAEGANMSQGLGWGRERGSRGESQRGTRTRNKQQTSRPGENQKEKTGEKPNQKDQRLFSS